MIVYVYFIWLYIFILVLVILLVVMKKIFNRDDLKRKSGVGEKDNSYEYELFF